MSRIRLNQEYRNKIANRLRVHAEQEDTIEKQNYDNLKADQIDINDKAWKLAEKIVRRHYTDDDVKMAYHLQNKFENVSTIAKDSCFHFHYLGMKEDRDYDNNVVMKEDTIESHFDFRLNGSIDVDNNDSYSRDDNGYGYALFRDELKAQDNCNPDILIEQEGKEQNPHLTKYTDNNDKYLGNEDSGYGKQWNEKYSGHGLVIIGVHAPEFKFEQSLDNLQSALDEFGIEWAVAQDNQFETWKAFGNRFWPAKYLIDSEGIIRYTHFGEGDYNFHKFGGKSKVSRKSFFV